MIRCIHKKSAAPSDRRFILLNNLPAVKYNLQHSPKVGRRVCAEYWALLNSLKIDLRADIYIGFATFTENRPAEIGPVDYAFLHSFALKATLTGLSLLHVQCRSALFDLYKPVIRHRLLKLLAIYILHLLIMKD